MGRHSAGRNSALLLRAGSATGFGSISQSARGIRVGRPISGQQDFPDWAHVGPVVSPTIITAARRGGACTARIRPGRPHAWVCARRQASVGFPCGLVALGLSIRDIVLHSYWSGARLRALRLVGLMACCRWLPYLLASPVARGGLAIRRYPPQAALRRDEVSLRTALGPRVPALRRKARRPARHGG